MIMTITDIMNIIMFRASICAQVCGDSVGVCLSWFEKQGDRSENRMRPCKFSK